MTAALQSRTTQMSSAMYGGHALGSGRSGHDQKARPPTPSDREARTVPLTDGLYATVDLLDYERVAALDWRARASRGTWYAQRTVLVDGKRTIISMHRFILGAPPELAVDHIDRNGLNNQRTNLRICTVSQNNANRRGWRKGKFRGVYWKERRQLWEAAIKLNGRYKFLGEFDRPEAAAHAYDLAAVEAFGEYATLNFPRAS
jgi:hypothetical protein